MASISLPGLASGLNSAELIASLLAIDKQSQTLLKNKATVVSTSVSALQGLNTQIAALGTLAESTAKAGGLDFYSATSSSTKVTATAAAGASNGSIDIVVGKLAQAQSGVTAPMTAWAGTSITIVGSTGTATEITPASSSLDDVVKAINASAAGVTATKVAAGTDAGGATQYRLQLSGKETGAAGSFAAYSGTAADVSAGTATNVLTQAGAATLRVGQDASVTLFAGTAAEQVLTSKTNTFAELLPGVSVTVSGVSTEPVTIDIARDTSKTSAAAAALIASVNTTLAYISTRSVSSSSSDAEGNPYLVGGAFTGDSTTRTVSQKVLDAASAPLDGRSPSEFGISITKSGTMEFNTEKFEAAFAKDPVATQKAVSEIASRLSTVATTASDKYTGTITAKITGQQSTVDSLNEQVSKWDDRLATRKTNLERYYAAFEVSMGNLNAQMTWLTSQVDALQASKD
ncbi:flagellar filament capping protein FliD [Conyzicola sp.]|uniref:flagellar filament capping protein FliD n=1 Tax=Conyzicola sp. TaxID=1969404 RepID=UPI003988E40D